MMRVESICLGDYATNCYLVNTNGITLLIDPAVAAPELFSWLDGRRVDMVINTHAHPDHVGGNWELQRRGSKILLHRAALSTLNKFYPDHPPIDRYIDEGEVIADSLRVLHTPGHCPGSIILVGEGVIFSGDLIFAGSIGRTDLPGGSRREIYRSLKRLVSLPGDYRIYPGHGKQTTLEQERMNNPFITRLEDR
jgi:glyoxylase-like metal-dependent hydrolase (beta-lactamase superfamily II)